MQLGRSDNWVVTLRLWLCPYLTLYSITVLSSNCSEDSLSIRPRVLPQMNLSSDLTRYVYTTSYKPRRRRENVVHYTLYICEIASGSNGSFLLTPNVMVATQSHFIVSASEYGIWAPFCTIEFSHDYDVIWGINVLEVLDVPKATICVSQTANGLSITLYDVVFCVRVTCVGLLGYAQCYKLCQFTSLIE